MIHVVYIFYSELCTKTETAMKNEQKKNCWRGDRGIDSVRTRTFSHRQKSES